MTEPIKLRWSSIFTYMKCQRRYDLQYNQQYVRNAGTDSRARILGSCIHAGIEAALNASFMRVSGGAYGDLGIAATAGVRAYWRSIYEQGKQIYDYQTRSWGPDIVYQGMMDDILAQALNAVRYQIPRIGLGTKYRVASVGEVIGPDWHNYDLDVAFVEFNFTVAQDGDRIIAQDQGNTGKWLYQTFHLTGTVDTVLQDLETGEYLMVDWKSRGIMPDERLVDLDGQLKFYAAVVNALAGRNVITRTCQYQMRTVCPKPAVITEKTRKVSMAAVSSTWEVWSKSVEALGLDPEDYRETMEPKMHPATDFTNPVFTPVTPRSSAFTIRNVLAIGNAIARSKSDDSWPGIPSLTGCQFCDMKNYCRVLENGGDPSFVLSTEYTKGELDETALDTEA